MLFWIIAENPLPLKGRWKSIPSFQKSFSPLFQAYLFGEKRTLKKKVKIIHRKLNLYHLFTPSGLHYSSFLMFFYWIRLRSKRVKKVLSFLSLFIFLFHGFYSLKRIVTMHLLILLPGVNSHAFAFILSFLFWGLMGHINQSPYSFALSFLFLGILFSPIAKIFKIFHLLTAQLLLGLIFKTSTNIILMTAGLFCSSVFSFIFPFYLLGSFLLPTSFIEVFEQSWIYALNIIYSIGILFPLYEVTFFALIGWILISLKKTQKWGLALFLLTMSMPSHYKDDEHSFLTRNLQSKAFYEPKSLRFYKRHKREDKTWCTPKITFPYLRCTRKELF